MEERPRKRKPVPAGAKPKRRSIRSDEALRANRLVQVSLRYRHNINGAYYGPGIVRVPATMAQALLEQDQRVDKVEGDLFDNKAALIIAPGRYRRVAPELFDQIWTGTQAPIFGIYS